VTSGLSPQELWKATGMEKGTDMLDNCVISTFGYTIVGGGVGMRGGVTGAGAFEEEVNVFDAFKT